MKKSFPRFEEILDIEFSKKRKYQVGRIVD